MEDRTRDITFYDDIVSDQSDHNQFKNVAHSCTLATLCMASKRCFIKNNTLGHTCYEGSQQSSRGNGREPKLNLNPFLF